MPLLSVHTPSHELRDGSGALDTHGNEHGLPARALREPACERRFTCSPPDIVSSVQPGAQLGAIAGRCCRGVSHCGSRGAGEGGVAALLQPPVCVSARGGVTQSANALAPHPTKVWPPQARFCLSCTRCQAASRVLRVCPDRPARTCYGAPWGRVPGEGSGAPPHPTPARHTPDTHTLPTHHPPTQPP